MLSSLIVEAAVVMKITFEEKIDDPKANISWDVTNVSIICRYVYLGIIRGQIYNDMFE